MGTTVDQISTEVKGPERFFLELVKPWRSWRAHCLAELTLTHKSGGPEPVGERVFSPKGLVLAARLLQHRGNGRQRSTTSPVHRASGRLKPQASPVNGAPKLGGASSDPGGEPTGLSHGKPSGLTTAHSCFAITIATSSADASGSPRGSAASKVPLASDSRV